MPNTPFRVAAGHPDGSPHLTVIGLFEDPIDANQALADLRGAEAPEQGVSLVVREHEAGNPGRSNPHPAVADALSEAALDEAGVWLTHLMSLIVPDDGALLVAGPLGAILGGSASVWHWSTSAAPPTLADGPEPRDEDARPLLTTLVRFGYGQDEADYLSQRVLAGSVLIGVTTPRQDQASDAHRVFAERGAVHIGTTWTDPATIVDAERLARSPVESTVVDEVVVLDAVSLLVSLCGHENPEIRSSSAGATVLDRDGVESGVIDDLLAELIPCESGADTVCIRYAVVAFGGLLGIGRRYVAVPAVYVKLDGNPITLCVDRKTLETAPSYRRNTPFSRHEEELVCDHFDGPRYWE